MNENGPVRSNTAVEKKLKTFLQELGVSVVEDNIQSTVASLSSEEFSKFMNSDIFSDEEKREILKSIDWE
jgi:hypothetical protein